MMLKRVLAVAGLATVLTVGINNAVAQPGPGGPGGGRFDPTQMRQRMMDNLREQLSIKDDAEWKALEPKISAVMEARMAAGPGGAGMMRGMRPPRNDNAGGDNQQQQRRQRFGQPSPAAEVLQKAIDAKAPAAEIKTKLEAYRTEVKEKEAALTKAQDDLKQLLTPQQEAVAVLNGLLK